ncbi:MAG: cation:proton antiporter [Candidatus Thorarchaeota archaeon]|nr:cation:proton antiporter [Candidatus Thorarchaeota archaeon]
MQFFLWTNPLLIIGAAIVFAYVGATLLRRVGIPQTLGFMIAGIILGVVGIFTENAVRFLSLVVPLALGLIGYNIGQELHQGNLGNRINKLSIIVIIEATATFLLVSFVTYFFVGELHWAFLFGAIASATSPAATADIVWEGECKGPLTSSLMFVLTVDDIVAIILTNSAIAYALWIYNSATGSLLWILFVPLIKILGAALIGGVFGVLYAKILEYEPDRASILEAEIGFIVLLVGIVHALEFSDFFAAMAFGYIVTKQLPSDAETVPYLMQKIMSPIIMLFFAMVGARMAHILTVSTSLISILLVAALYLTVRTGAKYLGARVGATLAKESGVTKRYLGSCLFCQAGVALGLSFVIEEQFVSLGGEAATIGSLLLGVVAMATMALEAIGPLAVKWSLLNAGELPADGDAFDPHTLESCENLQDDEPSNACGAEAKKQGTKKQEQ